MICFILSFLIMAGVTYTGPYGDLVNNLTTLFIAFQVFVFVVLMFADQKTTDKPANVFWYALKFIVHLAMTLTIAAHGWVYSGFFLLIALLIQSVLQSKRRKHARLMDFEAARDAYRKAMREGV